MLHNGLSPYTVVLRAASIPVGVSGAESFPESCVGAPRNNMVLVEKRYELFFLTRIGLLADRSRECIEHFGGVFIGPWYGVGFRLFSALGRIENILSQRDHDIL